MALLILQARPPLRSAVFTFSMINKNYTMVSLSYVGHVDLMLVCLVYSSLH